MDEGYGREMDRDLDRDVDCIRRFLDIYDRNVDNEWDRDYGRLLDE